jgi:hypothetical protein
LAAYVKRAFGREGIEKFAAEVHAKKSKCYAYAATFEALAEAYQNDVSERLESSPLSPWQLVAAVKRGVAEEDIEGSLGRAEEGETVRQINSTNSQMNVETVDAQECPSCGADSRHWERVPGGVR